jgi:hypothetical protein
VEQFLWSGSRADALAGVEVNLAIPGINGAQSALRVVSVKNDGSAPPGALHISCLQLLESLGGFCLLPWRDLPLTHTADLLWSRAILVMHENSHRADCVVVQPLHMPLVDLHLDLPAAQVGHRHTPTVAGDQDVADTPIVGTNPPAPDRCPRHFRGQHAGLSRRPKSSPDSTQSRRLPVASIFSPTARRGSGWAGRMGTRWW